MLYDNIRSELTVDIVLRGDQPVAADDLGSLIVAVSKDYAALTGRTLAIVGLERGSIRATLADLAALTVPYLKEAKDFLDATNAMLKFSTTVHNAYQRLLHGPAPQKRSSRKAGGRSIDAIMQVAIKRSCEVEFRHVSSDGSTTDLHVTPTQAIEIRAKSERPQLDHSTARVTETDHLPRLNYGTEQLVESLFSAPVHGDLTDAKSLVNTLVSLLRSSGLDSMIERFAQLFDSRGRFDLAMLIRAEADKSSSQPQQKI